MSTANHKKTGAWDTSRVIRRTTFFVLVAGLAITSIFFTFRGLSSPRGMEQAQIGREIARGNGYTTKVIRPIVFWQMEQADQDAPSLQNFPETYHAPGNPYVYAAVLKATGASDQDSWRIPEKSNIYQLDRVIAATSAIFLLISIGINYLLVSKMFDTTIASVMAVLMLLCELMWKLSQSGLPQMLMLMLFSCAMFFLWRAFENSERNRSPLSAVLTSGVFMCLLVLTHWLTLWIYIGFVVIAAIYFRPRRIITASLIGMIALFVLPTVHFLYTSNTGSMLGTAYYAIHNGLGLSEDTILRSLSPEDKGLGFRGLLFNIMESTLRQIADLYRNMGAILAAPLFFLALLHPFKRIPLANFRWALLLMWICAGIGMSVFGLKHEEMDPNQIHILFAPLMAAYGLAMLSVLWSRLPMVQNHRSLRYSHFIIIAVISAGPMLLSIPKDLKMGLLAEGYGGYPQWPPYFPRVYNHTLADNTTEQDVIISDVPWAVAWYADRISVWLPENLEQIEEIESLAQNQGTPISGILITPYSFNDEKIMDVGAPNTSYGKLYPLVFNSWARFGGAPHFIETHKDFKPLAKRYPYRHPLFSYGYITYHSKEPRTKIGN